ncbi:uncharacterized protein LOC126371843 [Pectinophora gossypiella]|uniref:uncharacterized protein LOC126371843 n=1 Tax=Pectinophora gossypiella TaxID=13191 RepID=UPI00214E00EA|nr:uncharacterized protein LOC126371843 [Pectinophora gossypiella]
MGVIQSIFCSVTFCVERVLTWTCCAFVLMLLMFTIIVLMIYGISVGYHYAQKELASFSMSARTTTEAALLRAGPEARPVVRLVAVNKTQVDHAPMPVLEVYQTKQPGQQIYLENSETPIVVLETERPANEPELSPHEKELARRLIGRFRRSRNNTTTAIPFFRPLKNSTF